jgi:hypothetical protein
MPKFRSRDEGDDERTSLDLYRIVTDPKDGPSMKKTSRNPRVAKAIRDHAQEVTNFVDEGMPAMMRAMMRGMTGR